MRTSRRLLLTVAALAAANCIRGDRLAEQTAPSCAKTPYPEVPEIELPSLDRAAAPAPAAPLLVIEREQIFLNFAGIGSLAGPDGADVRKGLADEVARQRSMAQRSGQPATDAIVVAAPKTTAAVAISALLRAAHASGFRRAHLLALPSREPALVPLARPDLAAELMAISDVATRQMRLAQTIEDAIWFCPDMAALFGALAAADPASKCEIMVVGMRETGFPCFGRESTLETVLALWNLPARYTTFATVDFDPARPAIISGSWAEMLGQAANSGAIGVQATAAAP